MTNKKKPGRPPAKTKTKSISIRHKSETIDKLRDHYRKQPRGTLNNRGKQFLDDLAKENGL